MEGVIGRFGTALGGVVVALGLVLAVQAQEAKKEAPKDLVLKGDAKCTRCHDAEDEYPVLAIAKTRHGVNADQRTPTCTSCHGDSENHINKPADAKERPKPDRIFKRNNDTTPPNVQVAACLTCHQGGNRIHFQGSGHERSQLSCASCHTVHAARDQVLVKETQAGVCFTCHKEKRAQIFGFSTHPLRTGWMTCSSCHQPHGSVSEFNLIQQHGQRDLLHVPRGQARPVPLGASAGTGELRRMPQPARRQQPVATEGARAVPLPAVPFGLRTSEHPLQRQQHSALPGIDGGCAHRAGCPDARSGVRELPLQGPREQPSVRPFLCSLSVSGSR